MTVEGLTSFGASEPRASIRSCRGLYARDVLGIGDIVFHTLDEGKNANWEGKCVPLVTYEKWTVGLPANKLVAEVCGLDRKFPIHPQLGLFAEDK